jgi:hypothetical protein
MGANTRERTMNGHDNAGSAFDAQIHPATRPGALAAIFDGFRHEPSGLTVTVTSDERVLDFHHVFFEVRDCAGELVGDAGRQFHFDELGRLVARHGTFFMRGRTGEGFGSALSAHSAAAYRDLGAHRIELHAVSDGAWAWSKWPGMQFDPRRAPGVSPGHPVDLARALAASARRLALGGYVPQSQDDVLHDFYDAGLISERLLYVAATGLAEIADGQPVPASALLTPLQVASLGRDEPWTSSGGQLTWLGRELIRQCGSLDWDGALFL